MWTPGVVFGWVALAAVFAVYLLILRNPRCKSEQVSLLVWLLASLLMKLVAPLVLHLCNEHKQYSYSIWYLTWAVMDFAAVLVIYYWHSHARLQPTRLTLFISMSFVTLASIQLAGYIDKAILETKAIDDVYRFLILSVNFAVAPMAVFHIARSDQLQIKGFHR